MAQLLALAGESSEEITVFINSQGGHVEAGDTIHDLVRFLSPRVRMVGTGWVASIAALIYVAVPREDRYCLPNTRDRKSTRLNSSHGYISYAVFCLKKKKNKYPQNCRDCQSNII